MDRRHFMQSASLTAATAAGIVAAALPHRALAQGSEVGVRHDNLTENEKLKGETAAPVTKRWVEQRWLLDNVIQVNGVDWDQPRTSYWNAPCGMEASDDFAAIRQV